VTARSDLEKKARYDAPMRDLPASLCAGRRAVHARSGMAIEGRLPSCLWNISARATRVTFKAETAR